MSALKNTQIDSHVVDILGSTKGRDQFVMLMNKALTLVNQIPHDIFIDKNTVFLDPFCKAGEIVLACAIRHCYSKFKDQSFTEQDIFNEIFLEKKFYGLAPDTRHYLLSRRTFYGNEKSHDDSFTQHIKNGKYLSEEDGKLKEEIWKMELNNMIKYIKEQNKDARIIAIGNPPYQENYTGEGKNTGANPIYHLFLNAIMNHEAINEFVMVIPSRWFAGGRGKALKQFAEKLRNSHQVVSIYDFENSKEVFPTVDVKGGVCFLHWNQNYNGNTKFVNVKLNDVEEVDLSQSAIIVRDSTSREIARKVKDKADSFLAAIAWSWNPFNIASNYFENNEADKNGDVECFTKRMIIKKIKSSKLTKNKEHLDKYKVVVPKAVKGGGEPYDPEQVFILGKNQICSESYMVVEAYKTLKEAKQMVAYLQTDLIRFLISLKKITQDITKETWMLVPNLDLSEEWTNKTLFDYFNISKEEQDFIKAKVKEWE